MTWSSRGQIWLTVCTGSDIIPRQVNRNINHDMWLIRGSHPELFTEDIATWRVLSNCCLMSCDPAPGSPSRIVTKIAYLDLRQFYKLRRKTRNSTRHIDTGAQKSAAECALKIKKNRERKTRKIVRNVDTDMRTDEREPTLCSSKVIAHYYSIQYTGWPESSYTGCS